MCELWPGASWEQVNEGNVARPEAGLLKLVCDKARSDLGWHSVLSFEDTVKLTADWYYNYYSSPDSDSYETAIGQIDQYCGEASKQELLWTAK